MQLDTLLKFTWLFYKIYVFAKPTQQLDLACFIPDKYFGPRYFKKLKGVGEAETCLLNCINEKSCEAFSWLTKSQCILYNGSFLEDQRDTGRKFDVVSGIKSECKSEYEDTKNQSQDEVNTSFLVDSDCINNDYDYGKNYYESVNKIETLNLCVDQCQSHPDCAGFSWTATRERCFLYKEDKMQVRNVSEEFKVISGTKTECMKKMKNTDIFIPKCLKKPSRGNFEGDLPRPIGGWCSDNPDTTKECGKKCIKRNEVCDKMCERNQCLAKNGSTCVEMFEDSNEFGKMLYKDCDGHCIDGSAQCDGKCGEGQCWETSSEKCLNPKLDRTKKESETGIHIWKDCEGTCIKSYEICYESCGDPLLFCWSDMSNKCLSIEEKDEEGDKIRRGCHCMCISYEDKCDGVCGYAQCEEEGKCMDVLQLDINNTRIRITCEEKCIPWEQECIFS